MKLIYDRGYHCYLACVASIAHAMGVDHAKAFFNLWSERDFYYNPLHKLYESARVKENWIAVGIGLQPISCTTPADGKAALAQIEDNGLFVVGMDGYWIPWHPVYRHFHGLHYFFAQKTEGQSYLCGDPVYGTENASILARDIENHTFELVAITKTPAFTQSPPLCQEAGEILRHHPETRSRLETEIRSCAGKNSSHIRPLIGRVDAMINNRRLFQKYLSRCGEIPSDSNRFFTQAFFSRWDAVKNGLHKAVIAKENQRITEEVAGRFSDLMAEELDMAVEIAAMEGCQ